MKQLRVAAWDMLMVTNCMVVIILNTGEPEGSRVGTVVRALASWSWCHMGAEFVVGLLFVVG